MKHLYSRMLTAVCTVLLLALAAGSARAQVGDVCDSPIVVDALPFTHDSTTVNFSYNYDAPCPGNGVDGAPDAVYGLTADSTGIVTVSLCGATSAYDTKLWVYKDTCVSGADVACNDDACGNANVANPVLSELQLWVDSGSTYYIIVGGFDDTEQGDYTIDIDWNGSGDCFAPADFALDSLNDTTAIISWFSANNGAILNWEFGPEGFTPGTGTVYTDTITAGC